MPGNVADHSECGSYNDSDDDDLSLNDETKQGSIHSKSSMLCWILTVFFKIIHHFKIPYAAASAFLSFISFLLGKCIAGLL